MVSMYNYFKIRYLIRITQKLINKHLKFNSQDRIKVKLNINV